MRFFKRLAGDLHAGSGTSNRNSLKRSLLASTALVAAAMHPMPTEADDIVVDTLLVDPANSALDTTLAGSGAAGTITITGTGGVTYLAVSGLRTMTSDNGPVANSGAITLISSDDLDVVDGVGGDQAINQTGGSILLGVGAGTMTVDSIVNDAASFVGISGGTLVATNSAGVSGGTIIVNGALTGNVSTGTAFSLGAAGTVTGDVDLTGTTAPTAFLGGTITGTLTLSDPQEAVFLAGTTTTVSTEVINNSATGTPIDVQATAILDTPVLTTHAGTINIAGTVTGDLVVDGSTTAVTTATTTSIGGNVTLNNGSSWTSSGSIAGSLTLNQDSAIVLGNSASVGSTVTINDTSSLVLSGAAAPASIVNNSILGALDSETGSAVTIASGANVAVGILAMNAGRLTVAGTLTGAYTNASGTNVHVNTGGTITGALTNQGLATLNGGTVGGVDNQAGATLTLAANSTTGTITNNGGTVNVNSGVTVDDTDLANTAGTVNLDGTLNVTAAPYTNVATLNVLGNGLVNNNVSNTGTGILSNAGAITGTLVNAGTATINGAGSVSGLVTNTGIFNAAGTATLATGLANTAGTASIGGGATVNGATTNDAVLNISGTGGGTFGTVNAITNTATGTVNVNANGRVTGGIGNAGTVAVNSGGAVAGGVVNQAGGIANISGTVDTLTNANIANVLGTGIVTGAVLNNAGTLTSSGTLQGTLGNSAIASVTGGSVAGLTTNSGTLGIAGALNGGLSNSGTADILSGGTVAGLTNTGGTTDIQSGGAVSGGMNVSGGTVTVETGGSTAGGATNTATLNINNGGTLSGTFNNNAGGATTIAGTLNGMLRNSGTAALAGATVNGTVANSGVLEFTGATSTGTVSNTGIATVAGGATLTAPSLRNNAGTTTIAGTLVGSLDNAAGATVVIGSAGGANVTGPVANAGQLTLAGTSTIGSGLTNTATGTVTALAGSDARVLGNFRNDGTSSVLAGGRLTVTGTTFNTSSKTLNVASGATFVGNVDNVSGGLLTVGGTLAGGVLNRSGATFNLDGAVVTDASVPAFSVEDGSVSNAGTMTLAGTIDGDIVNSGSVTVDGLSSVAGSIANGSSGVFDIYSNLDWGDFSNAGQVTFNGGTTGAGGLFANTGGVSLNGTLAAAVQNSGRFAMMNGSTVTGNFANLPGGTIRIGSDTAGRGTSRATIAGNLTDRGGTIDMANGTVGDVLSVGGAATLTNTAINVDVDLSTGSGAGDGDSIQVASGLTGTGVVLNFNVQGTPGGLAPNGIPILVVADGAASSVSLTTTGLAQASSGPVAYSVARDEATGAYSVFSTINPGIGGLAGTVTSVQSIIGSVINRPTSPFVSSLVDQGDKPCGTGAWARATGGRVDATNGVTAESADGSMLDTENDIETSYAGLQIGGDFACFDERYGGWNLFFGGIAGINRGESTQDVFFIDPNTGKQEDSIVTSVTDAEFEQTYLGVYLAGIRGPWAADLQFRTELTDFELTNTPEAGFAGLGLDGEDVQTRGLTFSGSVSRSFQVGETAWSVIPVAGFSFTRNETDSITFDNGGMLKISDYTSQVGFLGATLGKLFIAPDQTSATQVFATGTVYHDFSGAIESTFESFDGADKQTIETDNLGTFGEISLGASYVRVLDNGEVGPARQLNASLRLDSRFSDVLDGWGLTGQMRLQF